MVCRLQRNPSAQGTRYALAARVFEGGVVIGCYEQQLHPRLHNHLNSRSNGRGQERRQPALREPLTAGRRGGYSLHQCAYSTRHRCPFW